MKMVSPNDIHNAAKRTMLDGREPKTRDEWCMCVNFWAANISAGHVQACLLLGMIFDCPLTREDITTIAEFQMKKAGSNDACH